MKTLTFGLGLTLITANYLCPKGGRLEEVRLDLKLISQVYASKIGANFRGKVLTGSLIRVWGKCWRWRLRHENFFRIHTSEPAHRLVLNLLLRTTRKLQGIRNT